MHPRLLPNSLFLLKDVYCCNYHLLLLPFFFLESFISTHKHTEASPFEEKHLCHLPCQEHCIPLSCFAPKLNHIENFEHGQLFLRLFHDGFWSHHSTDTAAVSCWGILDCHIQELHLYQWCQHSWAHPLTWNMFFWFPWKCVFWFLFYLTIHSFFVLFTVLSSSLHIGLSQGTVSVPFSSLWVAFCLILRALNATCMLMILRSTP